MATVAQHLRVAREAQKLSITQIAEVTKIRTDHIRALEDGNYDIFAAPVYIRGFVRTYATFLKLDVKDDADAEKYLMLCSKYRREQDVWLAQIIAAGWNPNPPVN